MKNMEQKGFSCFLKKREYALSIFPMRNVDLPEADCLTVFA